MRCHARQPERWMGSVMLMCWGVLAVGCGAPPSVVPLLEVTQRAVRAEAEHLVADAERESHWLEQTRDALRRAYERDLDEQSDLNAAWVLDATRAYVTAREELVRHEMRRAQQRAQRRDNLLAAAEATQRAVAVLERQDALMTQVIGGRTWGLLNRDAR